MKNTLKVVLLVINSCAENQICKFNFSIIFLLKQQQDHHFVGLAVIPYFGIFSLSLALSICMTAAFSATAFFMITEYWTGESTVPSLQSRYLPSVLVSPGYPLHTLDPLRWLSWHIDSGYCYNFSAKKQVPSPP